MATPVIFMILAGLVAIPLGIVAVLYLVIPFFKAIGWVVRQAFRFIGGEVSDLLRIVGALLTQIVLAPLVVGSILIGRWSAAAHYGRALSSEAKTAGLALYRVFIGHPARLLCLNSLVDGIERRVPQVVAGAPTSDSPGKSGRSGQFDGYKIVGSLPGGGSGGKLYIAEPDSIKLAVFERAGQRGVGQVVIKTFSLRDGSSLPQIVRESRALDNAKRLGLVLEHELSADRFYYITRYVPGESLGLVTQRLHAMSGGDGLGNAQLKSALGYSADLLRTLDEYHRGGLWHKDVKPDNIIVDSRSAHLVDFGLITPLRSAMTLTTHGTEYFRDPELVRMALKGVKVHQVDGAKFDVYAAAAVLFSTIENSFPAHGGLSQITRRCPEALRWIVRRGMAEYEKRYTTASEMLRDVEHLAAAADPFTVKPFELPSMQGGARGGAAEAMPADDTVFADSLRHTPEPVSIGAGSDEPAVAAAPGGAQEFGAEAPAGKPGGRSRPRLRVKNWWSGGYVAEGGMPGGESPGMVKVLPGVYISRSIGAALEGLGVKVSVGGEGPVQARRTPPIPHIPRNARPFTPLRGVSAKDQLNNARARAGAARERARERARGNRHQRRAGGRGEFKPFNGGVVVALLLFAGLIGLVLLSLSSRRPMHIVVNEFGDSEQNLPGLAFAHGDLTPVSQGASPRHAAMASGLKIEIGNASKPAPRVIVDESELRIPMLPASMLGKRVLVMSDIQPPNETITLALDGLRSMGFTVMGNYPGNPAGEEEIERQLNLDSEAKFVRGLGQLASEDTSAALADWLSYEDAADALVWFGRGDEKDWVRYYIYTPASEPDDSMMIQERMALRTTVQAGLTGSNHGEGGR